MQWDSPLVIILAVAALALVAIVGIAVLPSTPAFKQIVLGVVADPLVTGTMRALLIYLCPVMVGATIAYLSGIDDPRLLPLVPILIGAIRGAEARVDGHLKPTQNSVNPPAVAGGGDRDLLKP